MQFQILELVLWSRLDRHEPRRLCFKPGRVNVVTGASKTGKSAIIPIIDYCLASEHCAIPVGTIRSACSWFGIVVMVASERILLARREPGDQRTTSDMFMLVGNDIQIPARAPSKNTSSESVKAVLNDLVGLTTLGLEPDGSSAAFAERPSFRDMMAFTFQPQNLIANPNVLFFKADSFQHSERLRFIFPYILGALTSDQLARQQESNSLRRELKRKERDLTTIRSASVRWVAQLKSWADQAHDLGLIESVSENYTWQKLRDDLLAVSRKSADDSDVTTAAIDQTVARLLELDKEESRLSIELGVLRSRATEMRRLRESADSYQGALASQRERLELSRWLGSRGTAGRTCPLCESTFEHARDKINSLRSSLDEVERTTRRFRSPPAAFDREMARVREEIRESMEQLDGVKMRRQALGVSSKEAADARYDSLSKERFLGKLEQALETYADADENGQLATDVARLHARIAELDILKDEARADEAKQSALRRVSLFAQRLLTYLDVENPDDPISLSIKDLTVKVAGDGRDDYLWEIGSGANWLAYHIAISVALQLYFIKSKESPVPSFIVYDQPSQVYFPRRLARRRDAPPEDPKISDEDVAAVRGVFAALSAAIRESEGQLQVIVLDHAGRDIWQPFPEIYEVDEWRDGKKLVPVEWLHE